MSSTDKWCKGKVNAKMPPEKKTSFFHFKKSLRQVFYGFLAFIVLAMAFAACEPINTPPDTVLDGDNNSVSTEKIIAETFPEKPTETQVFTATLSLPPTETPLPTATSIPEPTADPDIEAVDEELAEKIRNAMPPMWFYNREQKQFVIRPNEDFVFSIYKRTTLRITDSNGEEIGYARYFNKNRLDSENTDFFSLTDKSIHTQIPLKLYAQMGVFDPSHAIYGNGIELSPAECMFAFSENYQTYTYTDKVFPQAALDATEKYAPGVLDIEYGDELVETALMRVLAKIKETDESKILDDLKNDVPVVLTIDDKNWVVNSGIDFIWGDSIDRSFDVVDNHLVTYDGVAIPSQKCNPTLWGISLQGVVFAEHFEEKHPGILDIFRLGIRPLLSLTEVKIPVITFLRQD